MNGVIAWIQNYWIRVLGALALIALAVVGTLLVTSTWLEDRNELALIAEWNDSIKQLGIEPVFPPEEDIYVGDVLAVIVQDDRWKVSPDGQSKSGEKGVTRKEDQLNGSQSGAAKKDTLSNLTDDRKFKKGPDKALLYRAIKLYSHPMNEQLSKYYESKPVFPTTRKKPSGDDIWEQEPNQKGIFALDAPRKHLPLAVFPGFSINSERTASAGLSGWEALISGWKRQTDKTAMTIPQVETYGIPSVDATDLLEELCKKELSRWCSDEGLRKQLANVAGVIDQKVENPDGTVSYPVKIELHFINRVYLARYIDHTRDKSAKMSATAKYGDPPPPGERNSNVNTTSNQDPKKEAQEQKKEAQEQKKETPGGSGSKDFSNEYSMSVHQPPFQRPVVFGYRAVKKEFKVDLNTIKMFEDGK